MKKEDVKKLVEETGELPNHCVVIREPPSCSVLDPYGAHSKTTLSCKVCNTKFDTWYDDSLNQTIYWRQPIQCCGGWIIKSYVKTIYQPAIAEVNNVNRG